MAAVDFHALGQVVWVSLVAGVGVTVLFSLVIFGAGRADEARRTGEGHAAVFGALAVGAMIVFIAAVVLGVSVMLEKG